MHIPKPKHPVFELNGKLYKICTACGETLEVGFFNRKSAYNPSLKSKCIDCVKKQAKEYQLQKKQNK